MWFSGFYSCTTFAPSSSSIFLCCPLFDDSHILIFISYFCLLFLNYHILVLFFIGPNNIIVYIPYFLFMLGYPCLIFFYYFFVLFCCLWMFSILLFILTIFPLFWHVFHPSCRTWAALRRSSTVFVWVIKKWGGQGFLVFCQWKKRNRSRHLVFGYQEP
jgi:hypothetical protein